MTRVVFDQPVEVYFKEMNKFERFYRLEKCSLGKFLEFIDYFVVDIECLDSVCVRAFWVEFDGECISFKGVIMIVGFWNKFVYANGFEDESMFVEVCCVVFEFFDVVLGYFDYFGVFEW